MTENKKKILEMLAENKISADDAYRLLNAIDSGEESQEKTGRVEAAVKDKPRYLRVSVIPNPEFENASDVDRVNIRVPLSLIRAGIKLTSLIPGDATNKVNEALREKGINFDVNSIKTEDMEDLIEALGELEVDVVSGSKGEKVRVFVE